MGNTHTTRPKDYVPWGNPITGGLYTLNSADSKNGLVAVSSLGYALAAFALGAEKACVDSLLDIGQKGSSNLGLGITRLGSARAISFSASALSGPLRRLAPRGGPNGERTFLPPSGVLLCDPTKPHKNKIHRAVLFFLMVGRIVIISLASTSTSRIYSP
jgi:hypothetical protein